MELDITDDRRGPRGAVHGGIIACLADRAGAYAAVRSSGRPVVTSGVALSYMASARVGPLRAVAIALRIGGQQGVVEVRIHDNGQENRLVATALLTMSFLAGELSHSRPPTGQPG